MCPSQRQRRDGKPSNLFKILLRRFPSPFSFSPLPFLPPQPLLVSLVVYRFTRGANLFFIDPFRFRWRRPQVDLLALSLYTNFNRNPSNDSINMFSPRLATLVFVALYGIVNVAGMPVYSAPSYVCCILFGRLDTRLMALSARLVC